MRIRPFIPPLALLICLGLAGCEQPGSSGKASVAVVDMNRLLSESEPGKAGMAFLEGLQKGLQDKLNGIQDRLDKNSEDEEAQRDLQTAYMTFQNRMGKEQQNVAARLYDMLQGVLEDWRSRNGFGVVVSQDVALAFDRSLDVTDAILAEVNRKTMTFEPLEKDEPAPAADAPTEKSAGESSSAAEASGEKPAGAPDKAPKN